MFTSPYIQNSSDGCTVGETYGMLSTTIKWISGVEKDRLKEKDYLIKAKVQIREELYTSWPLNESISDNGYDPFASRIENDMNSSYFDKSFLNKSKFNHKK